MTPHQIRLVERSYAKIEPISTEIGGIFYDRLFALAPETRSLFPDDMTAQHQKFMKVIGQLVKLHLRSLLSLPVTNSSESEAAIPGARELGQRHEGWGVIGRHYELMRESLAYALQQKLQDEFTPELKEAWEAAFDVLAKAMTTNRIRGGLENPLSKAVDPDNPAEGEIDQFFGRSASG